MIVDRLQKKGFKTYLVGGCVRDLLLGYEPKDYDIATEALPEQVRQVIARSYIIGRRFKLVLVKRGIEEFQVATFRRDSKPEDFSSENSPIGDNFFGTPEQDARRRDFTINGLFYDPIADELIDYAQGEQDILGRTLRMLGDPKERLVEDPIRILRALRLSHKLNLKLDPELRSAIQENASSLELSVLPRRREELLKILKLPDPFRLFLEAKDLGVLTYFIPTLEKTFDSKELFSEISSYFERLPDFPRKSALPQNLFLPFVYVLNNVLNPSPVATTTEDSDTETTDELVELEPGLNSEEYEKCLRLELGLFRTEHLEIHQAFHFISRFPNPAQFIRRGPRRQKTFLERPEFEPSIHLAEWDYLFSSNALCFWKNRSSALHKAEK